MSHPFKAVTLIGKYMDPRMREYVEALAVLLNQRGIKIHIEMVTAEKLGISDIPSVAMEGVGKVSDLVIVLGGDGTMLTAARALLDDHVPLVGINRGRFGFLTDISTDGMLQAVGKILDGEYTVEQRILLGADIVRNGRVLSKGRALNDIVVSKGGQARLIELEVTIDGQYVHRQRSDGLIVSTPTGTTAYALSAGGPLLHPTLEAIALVPICPHTLSNRPFAINSNSTVEITLMRADDARVHFDGQLHAELSMGDKVIINRLNNTIPLLHPLGHSHYELLREKLHWG
ncbi:NAD+ kinase [Novimethylophilus kurashikiensis]|uniref:NAD kinase n=1 Tax=Novimethylophilus kurashikiensis TaxID=1825523 RepID=A0A2R5F4U4_9PROT|nr:NAD(+) kinase [Novimethylophilus kurashikiensis]GBG13416.1 NAD+ kinase [Novimethylophilus kurashikiensis]